MKSKSRVLLQGAICLVFVLASIELASQLAYRILKKNWYWTDRKTSPRGMVQPHPYFGAALIPSISDERNGVRISHNSFRSRGPEFQRPKQPGKIRVVALGGSTTYCTGVSDHETWETQLEKRLGDRFEVINLSTPGITSLENSLQTALLFSDVQPDIALYYLGWNDARVQHVKGLWPDWSDSHGKQMMAIGLSGKEMQERFASTYLLKRAAFAYFFPNLNPERTMRQLEPDAEAFTDKIDQRAMSLYVRNLKNIIVLCRKQNVTPIFIPQVMNYAVLTNDTPYGWLPFVRDKDLQTVIGAYNKALENVAKEEGIKFVGAVLDQKYGTADFLDMGHFSASGNERFAGALADFFAELAPVSSNLTTSLTSHAP